MMDRQGYKEAEFHLGNDGSKAFGGGPCVRVEVAKRYNAPFSAGWFPKFIVFDRGYSHGGERRAHNWSDTVVFCLGDGDPCREIF